MNSHYQFDNSSTSQFVSKTHASFSLNATMPWHKRAFDVVVSAILIVLFLPLFLGIAFAVKVTSKGSILHWSNRVGQNNRLFRMPKFRTMLTDTPQLATHLLPDPTAHLTPIGGILRKTSLDELPQLFTVLKGDLSLVGPRPALFNQDDLVALRTTLGIHILVPGVTGWAQVNGRDELPISTKARMDDEYFQKRTFVFDLRILLKTALNVARRDGISH